MWTGEGFEFDAKGLIGMLKINKTSIFLKFEYCFILFSAKNCMSTCQPYWPIDIFNKFNNHNQPLITNQVVKWVLLTFDILNIS